MITTRNDLFIMWLPSLSWSNTVLQRGSWITPMIIRCSALINRPHVVSTRLKLPSPLHTTISYEPLALTKSRRSCYLFSVAPPTRLTTTLCYRPRELASTALHYDGFNLTTICSLTISRQTPAPHALGGVGDVRGWLRDCTSGISNWCTASHRHQLNKNKTKHACFGERSCLNKLVNMEQPLFAGASIIQQAQRRWSEISVFSSTKNSVWLNKSLVHFFVLSRLDYGNSVSDGLLKSVILLLQSVQNAAARLILD